MVNYLKGAKLNRFHIGILIIITGFVIVRIPFFYYMPIPFINFDAFEYYQTLHFIESGYSKRVGFPGIGYPLFLRLCEIISNTSYCVVLMQSILQLFAILLFYFSYKKVFNKNLLFAALIIVGYATSNINLYYDTAYHPDSLMGSLFIIILSLFMQIIKTPNYYYFGLLSLLTTYTIAVRPNGVLLLPLIILYLGNLYVNTKNFRLLLKYLVLLSTPLLLLCVAYYSLPIYNTFNIISFPNYENLEQKEEIHLSSDHEIWQKILELDLNDKIINEESYQHFPFLYTDSAYAVYVMAYQRNYSIHITKDNQILLENYTDTRSDWSSILLDTCSSLKIDDKKAKTFLQFKEGLIDKFGNKTVVINQTVDFKHKLMHFIGFFQMFYKQLEFKSIRWNHENKNFNNNNIKLRYYNVKNSIQLNHTVWERTFKELKHEFQDETFTKGYAEETNYWNMKTSKLYRWIIEPYGEIQPVLFRNFLYPLVFCLVFCIAMFGLFASHYKSNLFLFLILASMLLLLTDVLFAFYFNFLYARYTYQISFIYYITLICLPLITESIIYYKKTGKLKY